MIRIVYNYNKFLHFTSDMKSVNLFKCNKIGIIDRRQFEPFFSL